MIAKYFFKLGLTGFGGPLALIQQMRQDLVENSDTQKNIMSISQFDQAFTMIKAMPGPIAFQMAVYCGHHQKKFWGGLIAGLGIILPSFFMMIILAILYDQIISNTYLNSALVGAQSAVAAVIVFGLYKLTYSFHKYIYFWLLSLLVGALFFLKLIPESILILSSGMLVVIFKRMIVSRKNYLMSSPFFLLFTEETSKIISIFKICFKTGALVFGTGLAAFPFLQQGFVNESAWLDLKTFNDAISFGQLTPGPVTISVAFMGYKIAHIYGALAATLGLYLPSFLHMVTWFPFALNWLSKQKWIEEFLLGTTAAVLGCVLVTVYEMNVNEFRQPSFWIIFISSLLIQKFKTHFSIFNIIIFGAAFNLIWSLF